MITEKRLDELQKLWDEDLDDTGDLLEAVPELIPLARKGLQMEKLESALEFLMGKTGGEMFTIQETLDIASKAGWKYKLGATNNGELV